MSLVKYLWETFGRKVKVLTGAKQPLCVSNTTVPAWVSTPPYDPYNGEVILGVDGGDRVQLAADGKLYPPLCSDGYPPHKTSFYRPSTVQMVDDEIGTGAAVTLIPAASYRKGAIFKPAAATLTLTGSGGGSVFPAGANDIVIPIEGFGELTAIAGVASCWWIGQAMVVTASTVTSR